MRWTLAHHMWTDHVDSMNPDKIAKLVKTQKPETKVPVYLIRDEMLAGN